MGVGGGCGWDGAIRLQWLQDLVARIAAVIPGQNTVASARAFMEVVPWCAEWRMAKIWLLRD